MTQDRWRDQGRRRPSAIRTSCRAAAMCPTADHPRWVTVRAVLGMLGLRWAAATNATMTQCGAALLAQQLPRVPVPETAVSSVAGSWQRNARSGPSPRGALRSSFRGRPVIELVQAAELDEPRYRRPDYYNARVHVHAMSTWRYPATSIKFNNKLHSIFSSGGVICSAASRNGGSTALAKFS